MARLISRAETWQQVYEAFQQVNFAAWDYDTIKKSLLDYLKLYYPEEDFNDYIESSELIVMIELFAYFGELLAYRYDMNAHENIMDNADRKESVLRLAKFLSYNSSRNIPARGLVKITSINSTEQIFDSRGVDLTNKTIYWNDLNNDQWKDQFLTVMNRVLEQSFGSVLPSDRVQVQDVVFELYGLNNNTLNNNVISYNVNITGQTYPMELVSSQLDEYGPYEKRPEKNLQMNVLYLSDGLGDSSDNTGFFFFTKQGSIQRTTATFDGVMPNQTFDILIKNSNEIDVWVNNIDPLTQTVIVGDGSTSLRAGEWVKVDVANSQNIIFNTNPNRNKFEIETLTDDQLRIIFGDGNFANIPSGLFEIWTRTSANADLVIPSNVIQNVNASIPYSDNNGKKQTLSFSFSLVDSIQNAAPSEDIEHIKRIAPAVYYTQDRMVNGRDYNEFMLQDNSILKLRAINRTFAGDSKYIEWHDPKEYYDNVKMFSDDGVIYFNTYNVEQRIAPNSLPAPDFAANASLTNALITNFIEPLLSSDDFYTRALLSGTIPSLIRTKFTQTEKIKIQSALSSAVNASPRTILINYNVQTNSWYVNNDQSLNWWISAEIQTDGYWDVKFAGNRVIIHSDSLDFWITNNDTKTITYDTLNGNNDQIVILSANIDPSGNMLASNYLLNAVKHYVYENGENKGLDSINDLILIPGDSNGDGIPDYVTLPYLISPNTYVYFNRECDSCEWTYVPYSSTAVASFEADQDAGTELWKREQGREGINFLWMHRTPRYHLVDPSPSNIIDMFVVTRGYYTAMKQWLANRIDQKPTSPTPFELKSTYNYLIESKMITDTLILHPGKIKLLFGANANDSLKCSFKVIRTANKSLTNNQIKASIVDAVNSYFDINNWEFGQTFYFTDLASYIHTKLPNDISSVVLIPSYNTHVFGDMFQVYAKEDEILQPSISVNEIEIVDSFNPKILKQF